MEARKKHSSGAVWVWVLLVFLLILAGIFAFSKIKEETLVKAQLTSEAVSTAVQQTAVRQTQEAKIHQATADAAHLLAEAAVVCVGEALPEAASLSRASKIHRMLMIPGNDSIPANYRASDLTQLELVGCLTETSINETKEYSRFGMTGRYFCTHSIPIRTISLREASTAQEIYTHEFYGSGGCETTEEFSQTQTRKFKQGVPPDESLIWESLQEFVLNPAAHLNVPGGMMALTHIDPPTGISGIMTWDIGKAPPEYLDLISIGSKDPAIALDGKVIFTDEVNIIQIIDLSEPEFEYGQPVRAFGMSSHNFHSGEQPIWSPDGKWVVYVSGAVNNIYLTDADGDQQVALTDDEFNHVTPAWKDSSTLLYSSDESGTWEIWSIGIDGENKTRLTDTGDPDGYGWPVFSAQDGSIVFECAGDQEREICLLAPSGEVSRLTNNTVYDGRPVLSPDGSTIAFSSNRDGTLALWLMDADGGNPRQTDLVDVYPRTWVLLAP